MVWRAKGERALRRKEWQREEGPRRKGRGGGEEERRGGGQAATLGPGRRQEARGMGRRSGSPLWNHLGLRQARETGKVGVF